MGFHTAHLVAIHHEVVCGDERFENHDPAAAGRALQQRVCQVGDADVQLIGAVDQVWGNTKHKNDQGDHWWIRTFKICVSLKSNPPCSLTVNH